MEMLEQVDDAKQAGRKPVKWQKSAFVPGILLGLFLGLFIRSKNGERKHRTIIDIPNDINDK